jgi:coenzyme Q-binding protein COQ10
MTNHSERIYLKYSTTQLFDLVADVERYPEFLPWVIAARIHRRKDQTIWTEMTMGTNFLRRHFSTVAFLDRPRRIKISGHDPMFETFEQHWNFDAAADGGTNVEYSVEYKFRSRFLQMLIGASFADRTRTMVEAFKRRARQLYGTPASSELIS